MNWILSSIVSYILTPLAIPLFAEKYPEIMLYIVLATIIFFISIIILGIFTSSIAKSLLLALPASVDKAFGFAFGFVKGYIIMAFFFAITVMIYTNNLVPDEQKSDSKSGRVGPEWLIESKSYNILELGANILQPVMDSIVSQLDSSDKDSNSKSKDKSGFDKKINSLNDGTLDDLKKAKGFYDSLREDDKLEQQGYSEKEIEKKDRLIETVQ